MAVKGHRIRITDSPFARMAERQQLDPHDAERNRILGAAGARYRMIWTAAGLEPIQGQDPGKIRSTAISAGLLGTEKKCQAFNEYSAASDCLHRLDRIAADMIILHDRPLEDVGPKLYAGRDKKITVAVAAHQLRIALEKLAVHFGMMVYERELALS